MRNLSRSHAAFTLIELLVVIAILAILAVVVVLVLNPAELLKQSRDANRLSDMQTLNSALNLYSIDQSGSPGFSFGIASSVYVSVPDPMATSSLGDQCQGLGLPALPTGWTYQCTASSTLHATNGTGWIPVDLKAISAGSPVGSLPVDPVNTTSTSLYYTYTTNGSQYELTMVPESKKYQLGGTNNLVSTDGGTLANTYEIGTNLSLEPLDYGNISQGIAFVQSSTVNVTDTSSTCPLLSTGKGDLLLVMYRINWQNISGITFSDTKGDTFISAATSSDNYQGMAYAYNAQGGNTAITMSGFASNIVSMSCFEYTGVQNSGDPYDGGSILSTSASTYQSGPITTTGSSDLLVGQVVSDNSPIIPNPPFLQLLQNGYNAHGWTTYTVQAIGQTAGVFNNQGSLSTSTSASANIAAFK